MIGRKLVYVRMGMRAKGSWKRENKESDKAMEGSCNTPESGTLSKREPQTFLHLFCEKLFLSSQHAGGLCGNLQHEPSINDAHSVLTKFVSVKFS